MFVKLDFLDTKKSSWLGITLSGPFPPKLLAKGIALRYVSEAEGYSTGIVVTPYCAGVGDRAI